MVNTVEQKTEINSLHLHRPNSEADSGNN